MSAKGQQGPKSEQLHLRSPELETSQVPMWGEELEQQAPGATGERWNRSSHVGCKRSRTRKGRIAVVGQA